MCPISNFKGTQIKGIPSAIKKAVWKDKISELLCVCRNKYVHVDHLS